MAPEAGRQKHFGKVCKSHLAENCAGGTHHQNRRKKSCEVREKRKGKEKRVTWKKNPVDRKQNQDSHVQRTAA